MWKPVRLLKLNGLELVFHVAFTTAHFFLPLAPLVLFNSHISYAAS